MRKLFLFILIVAVLVSCSIDTRTGKASVCFKSVKGQPVLSAYIDYTDADSLLWNITMTKTDGGETEGQGLYEDRLLTCLLTGFSLGSWDIMLDGYNGDTLVYSGSQNITLNEGLNAVSVPVEPQGEKGYLVFEDCNYTGTGNYLVYLDYTLLFSYQQGDLEQTGELYNIPNTEHYINVGVHNVRINYAGINKSFKVRVEAGQKTYVSFGVREGAVGLTVLLNQQEALVEE